MTQQRTGYVVFRLGDGVYATDLARVREIVRLSGLRALPAMTAPLAGVLDLRGAPLPVLDIRHVNAGRGRSGAVLVLEPLDGEEALGVAVDAVRSVVDSEGLEPSTGGRPAALPAYVVDVMRDEDGPVFLVDLRRMCEAAA